VSSPAVLDLDELVQPLPGGESPGGSPLPDDVRRELDRLRKDADPDFPETSDFRADWPKIVALTTTALTATGKDLTAAARLVEAATKLHGAAGLRDGLRLLQRLLADFWDTLHPLPDPGEDYEARRNRLDWLNDVSSGGRFPGTLMRMPLVKAKSGDWFTVMDSMTPDRKGALDEAIPTCSDKDLLRVYADLTEARRALNDLGATADEKLGPDSPNLSGDAGGNLGGTLVKCVGLMEDAARRRGVSLTGDTPADAAAPADAGGGAEATAAPTGVGGNREQIYRQIQQIASALRRIEPHSPIPYLLERCVRLGELPFPDLMREVIRESSALDELDRLLGVRREDG
jgi:type VI secretion system protein ImpA